MNGTLLLLYLMNSTYQFSPSHTAIDKADDADSGTAADGACFPVHHNEDNNFKHYVTQRLPEAQEGSSGTAQLPATTELAAKLLLPSYYTITREHAPRKRHRKSITAAVPPRHSTS